MCRQLERVMKEHIKSLSSCILIVIKSSYYIFQQEKDFTVAKTPLPNHTLFTRHYKLR